MMQIEIRTLDAHLAKRLLPWQSRNFANQSALHVALNTDLEEYGTFLRLTFFDDIKDDLSLVATDATNDELLGTLIARDLLKKRPKSYLPFKKIRIDLYVVSDAGGKVFTTEVSD